MTSSEREKPEMETPDKGIKERALEILKVLEEEYPDAGTLLNFGSPFELLVATILAAQCTDEMVNKVTPDLFTRYPDAKSLAGAGREELEELIKRTGFFRNKAASLLRMSEALVESHKGMAPENIEELVNLPGVGRKTANVIVGNCYGKPAVIVDTHFKRVIGRLGLSSSANPDRIETEIRKIIPEDRQTQFSGVINFQGRYRCRAKNPDCPGCSISRLCPYPEKTTS